MPKRKNCENYGTLEDESKAGDTEILLSLLQKHLVSETFLNEGIADWMNTEQVQEIADDLITEIVEKRTLDK